MEEMLEKVTIRKIRVEDAEAIGRIDAQITQKGEPIDFGPIIDERIRCDQDTGFVAEVEGEVVGYMMGYTLYGGFGLEKSAWISTLGVDPRYMGQGIGKRLAEEILEVCRKRGIDNILTSVRWDSVDLLSFFKTLGFDRSDFINLQKGLRS